jgi:hypothetical protein
VRRREKSLTSAENLNTIALFSSVLISALSGVCRVGEELQIYFQTTEINKNGNFNAKKRRLLHKIFQDNGG